MAASSGSVTGVCTKYLLSQLSARMTALRAHVADDDDDDEGSDWGDD